MFDFVIAVGEVLLKLGKLKEASEIYKELIDRNAENWYYYKGLESALQPRKLSFINREETVL